MTSRSGLSYPADATRRARARRGCERTSKTSTTAVTTIPATIVYPIPSGKSQKPSNVRGMMMKSMVSAVRGEPRGTVTQSLAMASGVSGGRSTIKRGRASRYPSPGWDSIRSATAAW